MTTILIQTGAQMARQLVCSIYQTPFATQSFQDRVAPLRDGTVVPIDQALQALVDNPDWGHETLETISPERGQSVHVPVSCVIMLTCRQILSQAIYRMSRILGETALPESTLSWEATRLREDLQRTPGVKGVWCDTLFRFADPRHRKVLAAKIREGHAPTDQDIMALLGGGGRFGQCLQALGMVPVLMHLHQTCGEVLDRDGLTPVRLLQPDQIRRLRALLDIWSGVFPANEQVNQAAQHLAAAHE